MRFFGRTTLISRRAGAQNKSPMETIQQIAAKYSYGRPDMQQAPAAPERTPPAEDRGASKRVGCGDWLGQIFP